MRARLAPGVATLAAAALAVALATSGCRALLNPESCHDIGPTIQPLEPEMLNTTYLYWPPDGVTTAVHIVNGPSNGYYTCQARGYVVQPIERVWTALSVPETTYLQNDPNGGTILDIAPQTFEPTAVASVVFRVFYRNPTPYGFDVKFDLWTWMGWLEGSEANPLELGLRTHKTCGTTHIQTMDGSITARPVDAADLPPGVTSATAIEMIYWLEAETQNQGNCNGTLQDQFNGLVHWLNTN
jgi:hypothetical protein